LLIVDFLSSCTLQAQYSLFFGNYSCSYRALAIMSVTTTENETVYRSARNVLTDYELHYSRSESVVRDTLIASPPRQNSSADTTNPPDWPVSHRRIPPHRPINYGLDPSQRNTFLNSGERIFVNVMFLGVRINAVSCPWPFLPFFCPHRLPGIHSAFTLLSDRFANFHEHRNPVLRIDSQYNMENNRRPAE
jgi:hypothetical protein